MQRLDQLCERVFDEGLQISCHISSWLHSSQLCLPTCLQCATGSKTVQLPCCTRNQHFAQNSKKPFRSSLQSSRLLSHGEEGLGTGPVCFENAHAGTSSPCAPALKRQAPLYSMPGTFASLNCLSRVRIQDGSVGA